MKRGIPQELLRAAALLTMLIDHVGLVLFPRMVVLRCIGRLAFPIFAFLLAEGADHTRHPAKYMTRLGIAALLSEIPFDLMMARRLTWGYQNVMLTLLLGLLAIFALRLAYRAESRIEMLLEILFAVLCAYAAEKWNTDYGAFGVMVCVTFWLFRQQRFGLLISAVGFVVLCFLMKNAKIPGTHIPIEVLGVLAIPLIGLYRGWRANRSKALQWAFYLFYPVHISAVMAVWFLLQRR